jgi:hypothetical protein
MEKTATSGKIKDPKIPLGIYPTNDTLITMTVDVLAIFKATTQEEVIASVFFDDNRDNDRPRRAPEYTSNVLKNSFITWVGAVKDIEKGDNRKDQVLIYDISDNPAMIKRSPFFRHARTIQNALGIDKPIGPTDYTIKFWVWDNKKRQGKGFQIDPKLGVNT